MNRKKKTKKKKATNLLHVSSAGSDVNVGSGVCLRVCARVRACVCVCVLESDLLFRIYLDCRFADLPIFT